MGNFRFTTRQSIVWGHVMSSKVMSNVLEVNERCSVFHSLNHIMKQYRDDKEQAIKDFL